MDPSGSSSEPGSNSNNSLLGGWGGDWGKKLTDGVAEVRKQVAEANLTPPKQPQSSSNAASDVEALKKRIGLLEGVIKKVSSVSGGKGTLEGENSSKPKQGTDQGRNRQPVLLFSH
mmetsp:Transcript_34704/g.136803  ORF Transcript_34704/g.136803 Transcript_34704/m.136803 type:complete len:116 (-) Transcript_34704:4219-4566(-)